MNVVICWSDISGYVTACWRELSRRPGIKLHVIAFKPESAGTTAFSDELMNGIDHQLLDRSERDDRALIRSLVAAQNPDVVITVGWFHEPYCALVDATQLQSRGVKFALTIDTPWRGTLRQKLAPLRIGSYIRKMSFVVVAGERAWQYARKFGVPERKILRGVYGFDAKMFENVFDRRATGDWPKSFLYVGRYVEDKAIDVLLAGYAKYRASVTDPWPLSCCGQGPFAAQVKSAAGVRDLGFVQPLELPAIFEKYGALVLPSRFEPWGVIVAEALSSGLPVICTEAVGASVELIRPQYNGLIVATDDPDALADAMRWAHENQNELSQMGRRAVATAAPFAAEFWAKRWHEMLLRCVRDRK